MNITEFILEFNKIINFIAESIDNQDQEGLIDVDINGDILHIETGKGIFVINKQTSLKEIWLSSPISGPYHFAFKQGAWKNRDDLELFSILSRELNIKL